MKKVLTELDKGEKGRITKILSGIESKSGAGHRHGYRVVEPRNVKRLKNLGVQVGKDLMVIAKQPFGPIVIEIDDIQTAIGRGMAHKIYVDKYETTRLTQHFFFFTKRKPVLKEKQKISRENLCDLWL